MKLGAGFGDKPYSLKPSVKWLKVLGKPRERVSAESELTHHGAAPASSSAMMDPVIMDPVKRSELLPIFGDGLKDQAAAVWA
jgi:hypothetical protein